jgi:hypothetical protein
MIAIITDPGRNAVISEFFELFKTPWEYFRSEKSYEVLLSDQPYDIQSVPANLVVTFARHDAVGQQAASTSRAQYGSGSRYLLYKGVRIPIYGTLLTFPEAEPGPLVDAECGLPVMYAEDRAGRTLVTLGYDLFHEIHTLLSVGQPICDAAIPALELHIRILRDLIVNQGISLIEIPPEPEGFRLIACLTHDIDHPCIRFHGLDHTVLGFVYRALISSPVQVLKGRATLSHAIRNCWAVLKLPFVHLGLANDLWQTFEKYLKLEDGMPSTYFAIPFKGYPGRLGQDSAPKRRGAAYSAGQIKTQLHALLSAGCEVGLHGLDAWHDAEKGREERDEICRVSGQRWLGVRMHWLYFDAESLEILEQAGFKYDSTMGYNETIGFRAGTTQVYRPFGATHLLELPLHIMDTALFLSGRLDLPSSEADQRIGNIIDQVEDFGGVVTINWHDRSIAPERLWDRSYVRILESMRTKGAWAATAMDVVQWFRNRRSVQFTTGPEPDEVRVNVGPGYEDRLPGLRVRVHAGKGGHWKDLPLNGYSEGHSIRTTKNQHAFAN